jgi:hypothetical protein
MRSFDADLAAAEKACRELEHAATVPFVGSGVSRTATVSLAAVFDQAASVGQLISEVDTVWRDDLGIGEDVDSAVASRIDSLYDRWLASAAIVGRRIDTCEAAGVHVLGIARFQQIRKEINQIVAMNREESDARCNLEDAESVDRTRSIASPSHLRAA